jgi:hypothetical protein
MTRRKKKPNELFKMDTEEVPAAQHPRRDPASTADGVEPAEGAVKIKLISQHSLKSGTAYDYSSSIADTTHQYFSFCGYDDKNNLKKRWDGVISTENLFEILLKNNFIKEEP